MNNPPKAPAAMSLDQLRQSVHAEIGQLLLAYQHIELMLKVMLPHLHAVEQAATEHADKDIDNLLDSAPTMALLVEALKKSVEMPDRESLADYVTQITRNRNALVHKFTMNDFGGLDSEAKCQAAIEYLKAHHEFAQPMRQMLLELVRRYLAPQSGA